MSLAQRHPPRTPPPNRDREPLVRPLRELVPLIDDELKAAYQAGIAHYRAAGALLLEAKAQLRHGEFQPWLKRHFALSARSARDYMRLAEETASHDNNGSALPFSSLRDYLRQAAAARPVADSTPIWSVIELEAQRQDLARREEERRLRRRLALDVIDAGYRVVAQRLHPDRGGSSGEMARLNDVRALLKRHPELVRE